MSRKYQIKGILEKLQLLYLKREYNVCQSVGCFKNEFFRASQGFIPTDITKALPWTQWYSEV